MTPVQTLYRWFNDNPEATYKEALEAYEHCLELEQQLPQQEISDNSPKEENKTSFGKISDESWEGCDGCTEQDEVMYKNGYIKGYNAAIAELPKEISDEEIYKASREHINDGGGAQGWIQAAFRQGAVWYREQLNNK